eukprot:679798-Ditylum_brightwellii.AAC.1
MPSSIPSLETNSLSSTMPSSIPSLETKSLPSAMPSYTLSNSCNPPNPDWLGDGWCDPGELYNNEA